jgi:hypothetical protein
MDPKKTSKDQPDEIAALNHIISLTDPKEIQTFVKGEPREGLLDAAAARINELKKQGEQPGPITQETHEFKGPGVEGIKDGGQGSGVGIQKTEILTGSDIIEEIDEADQAKADDAEKKDAALKAEQDKAKEAAALPRNYVTGEDVIKSLRAKGHKI